MSDRHDSDPMQTVQPTVPHDTDPAKTGRAGGLHGGDPAQTEEKTSLYSTATVQTDRTGNLHDTDPAQTAENTVPRTTATTQTAESPLPHDSDTAKTGRAGGRHEGDPAQTEEKTVPRTTAPLQTTENPLPHGVDFVRVAEAIGYLSRHWRERPALEQVAAQVHLSAGHFQRIFTRWAGVSPKQFIRHLQISHARAALATPRRTLFDAAHEAGLSGTGRLHDLFVSIEGMTPGEYRSGGASLRIDYSFAPTLFGEVLTASTPRGLCFMGFSDDRGATLADLRSRFPRAALREASGDHQRRAVEALRMENPPPRTLQLHLRGTGFQLKVWEALLAIPPGETTTYGELARRIDRPGASRAVGTAVGDNPVSVLIPCHRVIRATGCLGGYHWGPERKAALLGWERALCEE